MSIFRLSKKNLAFPDPNFAEKDGFLAVGGDLTPERIILAYQSGIIPWYNQEDPILWWSPNPRCVLKPENIQVSKSMEVIIKKNAFNLTYNQDFKSVITNCAQTPRKGEMGTWLTNEMIEAYCYLHTLGFCHSVEVWKEEKLIGGLYGGALGKVFFGESMFSHQANSSKIALIFLAKLLAKNNFTLIDCQVETSHLISLGAELMPRKTFLKILKENDTNFINLNLLAL